MHWRLAHRESPAKAGGFHSERRQSIIQDLPGHDQQQNMIDIMRAQYAQGNPPPGRRPDDALEAGNPAGTDQREVQNARALVVLGRIKEKLTGHDFKAEQELNVPDQVEKLLAQATSVENLCQHYIGWCSFW